MTDPQQDWCEIMDGLGLPNGIRLSRSDTPDTMVQVLPVNAYGMKHCNWK